MEKESLSNFAFIDGQNLHQSIKEQGWKLDHKKFRIYLEDKYHIAKAFYFLGRLDSQKRLYRNLEKSGFTLIFKKVLPVTNEIPVKGNVDTDLVLHCMIQINNFRKAFIVTGDGDYYCLLEYLEKTNKLGGVIIPNRQKYSALLRGFGNKRYFINDQRKKLEFFQKK
ncbi:MAG: NYN domain-containing protein [Sedimentisphaerales bacterium]|nr:NYN domain-containing protein [Sedimentisphaerales bacterium]